MPSTPREIILENIECRCGERIGFNFDGGRRNDFAGAGVDLPTGDRGLIEAETRRLVETFHGGFIAKNYSDLNGIGVRPEWDQWAYEAFLKAGTH